MQIPLNVLLYQYSANSIYEVQNADLSVSYDGIQLFDQDYVPENNYRNLYLISTQMLASSATEYLCHQILNNSVFLCICQDESIHVNSFPKDLSLVLLYTKDSFPQAFNKFANIFHNFDMWDKNFHLMMLQQKTLQELLNLSRDYLVHPMVMLDRNYSVLGYIRHPETTDPIMEDILAEGYVTPQTMTRLRQEGLMSTSENADNPLINWYCLTSHDCYYSMMYRFSANNHVVGYALIFRCSVHPRTNFLYLMNIISENLTLYFQQERFANRSSSEIYESIFTEILEHPNTPGKQYEDQISYIPGLSMEGRFLLARISYTDQADLPHTFVCWNLRNSIPKMKPFIYRNTLYVLRVNEEGSDCFRFLTPEEEILFRKNFRGHMFSCGISNPFFSLMDLPTAAAQCAEALRLGPDVCGDDKIPYRFSDVMLYYMLRELKRTIPIKMISSPCYTLLRQYDAEKGTDLCEVFMEYLKNGRNINQTSSAIYLHRNTVLNKVKKATSIMQNECEDYQTQTAFILAYLEDHTTY